MLGGFALDRVLSSAITRNFDEQLNYAATALIAVRRRSARTARSRSNRPLSRPALPRALFGPLLAGVGAGPGAVPLALAVGPRAAVDGATRTAAPAASTTATSSTTSRCASSSATRCCRARRPSSTSRSRRSAATSTRRSTRCARHCCGRLALLGLGLLILSALQTIYGLWPLRRVSRAIAAIRSGAATGCAETFPPEIAPMVDELNELLDDNAAQAEAARLHAGNLAHALKTPMSVLIGAAREDAPDLAAIVVAADRDHAAPGRSPARPRPRRRPPRGERPRAPRSGRRSRGWSARLRGSTPSADVVDRHRRRPRRGRSAASGRTSRRCSAT